VSPEPKPRSTALATFDPIAKTEYLQILTIGMEGMPCVQESNIYDKLFHTKEANKTQPDF